MYLQIGFVVVYHLYLKAKDYRGALVVLDCTYYSALMSAGTIVVHAMAEGGSFDALAVPSTAMSLVLGNTEGFRRHLHGILVTCNEAGWRHGKPVYRLELSSWWSLLGVSRRCRIFQDMSVPDIIRAVMAGFPMAQIRFELSGVYEPRTYCVQYRETDHDFCHRLLEDVGIYYRIDHEADTHTIVFCDNDRFPPLQGEQRVVHYQPDDEEGRVLRPGIQALDRKRSLMPQRILVNDYDYHNPAAKLQVSHGESDSSSWYIDTSGHTTPEQGAAIARLRKEAVASRASTTKGRANFPGFDAGRSFQLQGHPDPDRDRLYHLLTVEASFVTDGPDSSGTGFTLCCQFEVLDEATAYKPPRVTGKPAVPSLQGATVVGPSGAEVHTDALARVRVCFHWDNEHDAEEDSSCWMRVAQPWAGKGWGSLMLPRVGQEVLVGFVEGDIDRPIVIATVYNAENLPPFELPAQASYTGLVSRSWGDGRPSEASSIILDDARGAELLKLHAERDMKTSVEQNQSLTIGKDQTLSVGGSMTTTTPKSTVKVGESITRKDSSTSWTGASMSITEVGMAYRGISSAMTGVNNSLTGVSTSMTGINQSVNGVQISIVGDYAKVYGNDLSIVGVSTGLVGTSHRATGFSISVTGVSHSSTGVDLKKAGSKSSKAGSESKTRGMQSKN